MYLLHLLGKEEVIEKEYKEIVTIKSHFFTLKVDKYVKKRSRKVHFADSVLDSPSERKRVNSLEPRPRSTLQNIQALLNHNHNHSPERERPKIFQIVPRPVKCEEDILVKLREKISPDNSNSDEIVIRSNQC